MHPQVLPSVTGDKSSGTTTAQETDDMPHVHVWDEMLDRVHDK